MTRDMARTKQDRIAAGTATDAVMAHVGNLGAMTAYYRDATGAAGPRRARPERRGLADRHPRSRRRCARRPAPRPRPAQAAAVATIASRAPATFVGSAGHVVSKALCFTDPDRNGIELCWDRGGAQ